jgi:hypothetical protein
MRATLTGLVGGALLECIPAANPLPRPNTPEVVSFGEVQDSPRGLSPMRRHAFLYASYKKAPADEVHERRIVISHSASH